MSQIEVSVYDQNAYFTHTPNIYSGDIDTDTVKFRFDDTWNDFKTKTVVFYNNPKRSYPVMLNSNNVAIIPAEVMNIKSKLYFGVIGTNKGVVKTSSILSYRIERGSICANTEIIAPSTNVWLQILSNYEKAMGEFDGAINTMNTRLNSQDAKISVIDKRVIDSAQENKANINLDNLNDAGKTQLLNLVNMDTIKDGQKYTKVNIQYGNVDLPVGGDTGSIRKTVTFAKPYKTTPTVLLSLNGENGVSISASVLSVSTSNFVIDKQGANGRNVSWVAFGTM